MAHKDAHNHHSKTHYELDLPSQASTSRALRALVALIGAHIKIHDSSVTVRSLFHFLIFFSPLTGVKN